MGKDNGKIDSFSMLADIHREVGETSVAVKNVDKKIDSHIDYSLKEFKAINKLDAEQNRILDKHVEGVNTLKDMHVAHRAETKEQIGLLTESLKVQKKDSHERLEALERPYELVKYAGKVFVWVLGVAVAALIGAWIKGWI